MTVSLLYQLRSAVTARDTVKIAALLPILQTACDLDRANFTLSLSQVLSEQRDELASLALGISTLTLAQAADLWSAGHYMYGPSFAALQRTHPELYKEVVTHPLMAVAYDLDNYNEPVATPNPRQAILEAAGATVVPEATSEWIGDVIKYATPSYEWLQKLEQWFADAKNLHYVLDATDVERWCALDYNNRLMHALLHRKVGIRGVLAAAPVAIALCRAFNEAKFVGDKITPRDLGLILDGVTLTQETFEAILKTLPSLTERVAFCHRYFIDGYNLRSKIHFDHRMAPITIQLLKDPKYECTYSYLTFLDPARWDAGVLAQMYHCTTVKTFFVLYAVSTRNAEIVTETFRAYKGGNQARYEHLDIFLSARCVTDSVLSAPHIGRFIEYVSTQSKGCDSDIDPTPVNMLVPELQGWYQG